jgi:hypothetical protein
MQLLRVVMLCMQSLFFMPVVRTQNIDSLVRAIDSSSKTIQKATKDLDRWKDSSRQIILRRQTTQNSKSLDQFLADRKEQERVEKRRTYLRIASGAAFVTVLVVSWARRRKKRNE